MGRKRREWYKGAVYHITARGNNKQDIFIDKNDYEMFMALLLDAVIRFKVKIHAYCLMTNHFHLLIETADVAIWTVMNRINSLYAMNFNEKYGRSGHLFQGRYKSFLIENDAYFLQTSRYIHLNPVKAQIVDRAEDYSWSSYKTLIGVRNEKIITKKRTYHYFNQPAGSEYKKFIENATVND